MLLTTFQEIFYNKGKKQFKLNNIEKVQDTLYCNNLAVMSGGGGKYRICTSVVSMSR